MGRLRRLKICASQSHLKEYIAYYFSEAFVDFDRDQYGTEKY